MRLADKVAIITGAGLGIGRATALLFAQEGAKVVVAELDPENGTQTAATIQEKGGDAIFVATDVTKSDDCQKMVRAAVDTYGRLDILVNNAGLSGRIFVEQGLSEEEVWDKVMAVNAKGVALGCKYAIPEMIKAGGGSIVNIGSIVGLVGMTAASAYGPSKGAVIALTRALAVAHAKDKVRVNTVCPGVVNTTFFSEEQREDPQWVAQWEARHPIGRLGRPEDIAYACLYLASDESSFVTGSALVVDGGYTAQ